MCLVKAPIQPKPAGSAMPGCCPAMGWPNPTLGRTGMKTSRLFLRKHCQPRAQQDDFKPSTLAGHRFGKGTLSRLKRCCSWVCHLLSIPDLGGETLGEIAGETIGKTIFCWNFLYFSGFNKHFNRRFNWSCGRVKGFRWMTRQPSKNILADIQICPHDTINSSVLCWEWWCFPVLTGLACAVAIYRMGNRSGAKIRKKWERKWEMAPGLKWPKNGRRNGKNREKWPKSHFGAIFPFRRPFFGHFRPGAIFHFLSHSFRIFAPDRFPIL